DRPQWARGDLRVRSLHDRAPAAVPQLRVARWSLADSDPQARRAAVTPAVSEGLRRASPVAAASAGPAFSEQGSAAVPAVACTGAADPWEEHAGATDRSICVTRRNTRSDISPEICLGYSFTRT